MEPVNEVLRAHSADEMVCKVWMAAMEQSLTGILQAPAQATDGWFEMVYPKLDLALDMADTITEAFIARFRTEAPASPHPLPPGDTPAK
ncbi:hypothetical protein [Delftia acidovorans]|jgi:hypothetical protein|uniref:hypothetical protein n=1 Tax=Delftia acidovorans TaxID=80866 RepID=UPI002843B4F7|nr:hypothetical protein [Delftia acidovorans]